MKASIPTCQPFKCKEKWSWNLLEVFPHIRFLLGMWKLCQSPWSLSKGRDGCLDWTFKLCQLTNINVKNAGWNLSSSSRWKMMLWPLARKKPVRKNDGEKARFRERLEQVRDLSSRGVGFTSPTTAVRTTRQEPRATSHHLPRNRSPHQLRNPKKRPRKVLNPIRSHHWNHSCQFKACCFTWITWIAIW